MNILKYKVDKYRLKLYNLTGDYHIIDRLTDKNIGMMSQKRKYKNAYLRMKYGGASLAEFVGHPPTKQSAKSKNSSTEVTSLAEFVGHSPTKHHKARANSKKKGKRSTSSHKSYMRPTESQRIGSEARYTPYIHSLPKVFSGYEKYILFLVDLIIDIYPEYYIHGGYAYKLLGFEETCDEQYKTTDIDLVLITTNDINLVFETILEKFQSNSEVRLITMGKKMIKLEIDSITLIMSIKNNLIHVKIEKYVLNGSRITDSFLEIQIKTPYEAKNTSLLSIGNYVIPTISELKAENETSYKSRNSAITINIDKTKKSTDLNRVAKLHLKSLKDKRRLDFLKSLTATASSSVSSTSK